MIKQLLRKAIFLFKNVQNNIIYKIKRPFLSENSTASQSIVVEEVSPIWIMGMFRSGTSLTCDILSSLGIDFGEPFELHQSGGVMKELNPNGFFELFIYAKLARFWLKKLGADGRNPPSFNASKTVDWNDISDVDFSYFSLVQDREPRVSRENKYKILKKFNSNAGFNGYFDSFSSPFAIKVPMLSPFSYPLLQKFPKSKFLIVFRHPVSTVLSANKLVGGGLTNEVYAKYYENLLEFFRSCQADVIFFSYDHLLSNPVQSINALVEPFDLQVSQDEISGAASKIEAKLIRNKVDEKSDYLLVDSIYNQMLDLAINTNFQ